MLFHETGSRPLGMLSRSVSLHGFPRSPKSRFRSKSARVTPSLSSGSSLGSSSAEWESLVELTLRGRETAIRVAREERVADRSPWTRDEVCRYNYHPNGPDDFTNRTLLSLLDVALVGHCRRVAAALADADRVRTQHDQAKGDCRTRLEDALYACREDPRAVELIRQASHAQEQRALKDCERLRSALLRLEEETATAQTTHAAAMRCLAARHVAQHDATAASILCELESADRAYASLRAHYDAIVSCLLTELDTAEETGVRSLRRLEGVIEHMRAQQSTERAAHGAEVAKLRSQLEALGGELQEERRARAWEARLLRGEVTDEAMGLERQIARAEGEKAVLTSELAGEESSAWSQARLLHLAMGKLEKTTAALEASRDEVKTLELGQLELRHELARHRKEAQAEAERLCGKIVALHKQNAGLFARVGRMALQ